ncbi:hypothetical protein NM208_g10207 [Fusarium decemcellulare]|uniref:Uncharacterized protein n=1 Tax=Fusarium decemcellulare TaxID=57161 RepID=A0ACC1RZ87_9HYPO|nr:hypothetical protein NM208_g10207 [Fusarium decemcellulare]
MTPIKEAIKDAISSGLIGRLPSLAANRLRIFIAGSAVRLINKTGFQVNRLWRAKRQRGGRRSRKDKRTDAIVGTLSYIVSVLGVVTSIYHRAGDPLALGSELSDIKRSLMTYQVELLELIFDSTAQPSLDGYLEDEAIPKLFFSPYLLSESHHLVSNPPTMYSLMHLPPDGRDHSSDMEPPPFLSSSQCSRVIPLPLLTNPTPAQWRLLHLIKFASRMLTIEHEREAYNKVVKLLERAGVAEAKPLGVKTRSNLAKAIIKGLKEKLG